MTRYTHTPVVHQIFNELDSQGLFLGLPRIEEERNAAYKQRLLDVFVHRASSTYLGLLHGITRELGLSIQDALTISNVLDANDNPVLPYPAVIFEETKCTLYSDFKEQTILEEIERFDNTSDFWTLGALVSEINATGYFTATLASGVSSKQKSMTIFNQSSVKQVLSEDITQQGQRIKLLNRSLVDESVTLVSSNLTHRVDTENDLTNVDDYYIDLTNGLVIANSLPASGSVIRYQYSNAVTIFQSSPVIIHNLQSDDFQTKMFEQVLDEDGNEVNGHPTAYGADIINELLSVFHGTYGK